MTADAGDLVTAVAAVAGVDAVSVGTADAAIAGVTPALVVAPETPDALAGTLGWAADRKLSVVPTGAGTKLDWGGLPPRVDLLLSTARLDAVREHRHGDLTVTVEAGAPLARVNAALGRHAQWIPLDPYRADRATIGGIVSTNDSGPRRHRHGAPRDLIIGVTVARADGRLARAGGTVVKNVAGYDLSKLLSGSFGSLGVIVSMTFKLAPVPAVSRTVEARVHDPEALVMGLQRLLASQVTPSAVELEWPPGGLLVRFETLAAAADRQAAEAVRLVGSPGATARVLEAAEEADRWARHAERPWQGAGAVLKVGLLPLALTALLRQVTDLFEAHDVDGELVGRAGLGVLYLRIDGSTEAQARVVRSLREHLAAAGGHAVVLRGSAALKRQVGPWGPLGDALGVMSAIKRQFDPHRILSPGRWPLAT